MYEDFEYAQAREAFRAASGLDPRSPVLLAWVSRTAQLVKAEDEATETADRAVSLLASRSPRVDTLFVQAVASEVRRDASAAESFYRELTRERPDDPTWAMELGAFLDRQARNADAVSVYHGVLTVNERLLRPQLELCRMYSPSRLNEPVEARKYGETALRGYRTSGARAGEAQSLLCLTDTLAVGNTDDRKRALAYAESAREIFNELRYDYSAARAEYDLALMAATRGNLLIHRCRREGVESRREGRECSRTSDHSAQSRRSGSVGRQLSSWR